MITMMMMIIIIIIIQLETLRLLLKFMKDATLCTRTYKEYEVVEIDRWRCIMQEDMNVIEKNRT